MWIASAGEIGDNIARAMKKTAPAPQSFVRRFRNIFRLPRLSGNLRLSACALLWLAAGGCSGGTGNDGFDAVQKQVLERTGQRVVWNRGSAEDAEAEAAVRELLRQDLDAERAVQVALLNNRDVQATYEELGVAQADLVQAGLLRNPAFVGELWFFGDGGNFELSITQNFIDIFLIPLKKRAAAATFEASKARVCGAVIDLAADVCCGFYRYQAAEQTLEMRRSIAAATDASWGLAQRIHAAGNMTDLDLSSERAFYEQAALEVTTSEAEAIETRERLNELMGLSGAEIAWKAVLRLPELPAAEVGIDGLESRAVAQSIEMEAARRAVGVAAARAEMARPAAVFGDANGGFTTQANPDGTWGYGPTFSLPVPIFDPGNAAAMRAAAELRAAQQRCRAIDARVRARTRAAAAKMQAARSRAERCTRTIVPLRHEITEETQRRYNGMFASSFQLIMAKQQEIEAGRQSIEALRDYWVSRSEVERTIGGRLASSEMSPTTRPAESATHASGGV